MAQRRFLAAHRCSIQFSLACLIILSGFTRDLHAQRYLVHTYTESDGLPSSIVYDITQDASGRMWFATRFGVASFDGWEWTRYDVSDRLPRADQRRVMSDDAGRVWCVGEYGRSAVFEDGAWRALPAFEDDGIDRTVPATVVRQGERTLLIVGPRSGGVRVLDGERWNTLDLPPEAGHQASSITSDGRLVYVATEGGVYTLDPNRPEQGARLLDGAPKRRALALSTDRSTGALWIVGDDYVGRLRDGQFEIVRDDVVFEQAIGFYSLVCEPDLFGGLYVGNPAVVYRCDLSGCERLGQRSGLVAEGVTSLYLDREGNMWVASLRGVSKIVGLRFANYTSDHGLEEDEVTAVVERRDGSIILGHRTGLTILGKKTKTIALPGKFEARVLDLAEDRSGNVWAAVNAFGLARIDRKDEIEWVATGDSLEKHISSVMVDRSDRLWVLTRQSLRIERENRFEPLTLDSRQLRVTSYLRRLFEGRDGSVYIATNCGLYVVRPPTTTLVRRQDPQRADNIYSVYEDTDGTIWLGSIGGLYVLVGETIEKVRRPGPQIDRPVYFIVADRSSNLWFGTDNGVMRWDGTELVHITLDDGLVGRETNRAAGVLDSSGRLWIGMDRGVSVYRPGFDIARHVPPLLEFAGVDVNGDVLPLDRPLELEPGDNTLVFRFRAMSFADEDRVIFRCRLEGFEDDWTGTFAAPNREIRYTNIPPGTYTFHLQAAGPDGTWSAVSSTAPIAIDAPIWRKPQFLALSFALLALAVFVGVGYVSQRRYARRLENEVHSRVEELHQAESELEKARRIETLGVLAGGIAHDFNNLLTVIMGNLSLLEDGDTLDASAAVSVRDALAATDRARSLTQQLLTFSRGGAPIRKPGSIADVIEESASFAMSGSNVRCDIDLPRDLWTVDIDAGQMSQVVNNLLLNAKQAMPDGGVVTITGRNHTTAPRTGLKSGRYVEISIADRGAGIPSETLDRVFDPYYSTKQGGTGLGLATAYSIVKRHEGLLTLDSEVGAGTKCRIYLPASQRETATSAVEKPATNARRGHILVMDDEKAIRDVLERLLTRMGHEVEFAGDGREAISIYKRRLEEGHRFDAVIMDLTIPGGMGGKETLERLRNIDPRVKAIVASGYSNDPVVADFSAYGFCGCLSKPFSVDQLTIVLGGALSKSSDAASPH